VYPAAAAKILWKGFASKAGFTSMHAENVEKQNALSLRGKESEESFSASLAISAVKAFDLHPKKSERLAVVSHPTKAINVAVYYPRIPGP
jgi:hypothetical protein